LAATGLDGGTAGCVVVIRNTGSGTLTFAHASGSSDADNRFTNAATSAPTPVAAGGYIIYIHDGTNWDMVAHDQGAWITPTFADSDFTGSASGDADWVLVAGDVTTMRYRLIGKTLNLNIALVTTTVANTPATLIISNGQFGSFTTTSVVAGVGAAVDNGGTREGLYWFTGAAGSTTSLQLLDGSSWANSTNGTLVVASTTFEVT
jgi:hypothetical protein